MNPSGKALADVARSSEEKALNNGMLCVNDDKAKTAKIPLAAAEGVNLSKQQLRDVFGILPETFGSLPTRIIIPDLYATETRACRYTIQGTLYIAEPISWIPRVHKGTTIPASIFKDRSIGETSLVYESSMTVGDVPAYLTTNGKPLGTTTTRPTNKLIYSVTNHNLRDDLPPTPIHQLTVFPLLQVRAIKEQAICFQIATDTVKLEWPGSYKGGYWEQIRVQASNIARPTEAFVLHPLPLLGSEVASEAARILPFPHFLDDGELQVTTMISMAGSSNWFIWDEQPWIPSDRQFSVPAPNNTMAFQAATAWYPLDLSLDRQGSFNKDQQEAAPPPREKKHYTGDLTDSSGVAISSNEDYWYKIVLADGSELGLGEPEDANNGRTPVLVVPSGQGMVFRYQSEDGKDIRDQGWPMGQKGYLRGMHVEPNRTQIIQNMSFSGGSPRLCMYDDNTNYGIVAEQISGNRVVLYGYRGESIVGMKVTPEGAIIGYGRVHISGLVCSFVQVGTSISKGWF